MLLMRPSAKSLHHYCNIIQFRGNHIRIGMVGNCNIKRPASHFHAI